MKNLTCNTLCPFKMQGFLSGLWNLPHTFSDEKIDEEETIFLNHTLIDDVKQALCACELTDCAMFINDGENNGYCCYRAIEKD